MKTAILFLLLILAEYQHAADFKFYPIHFSNNKTAASYQNHFESRLYFGLQSSPIGDTTSDTIEYISKQLTDELQKYTNQLSGEKTWSGTITIEEHTNRKWPHKDPGKPGGSLKADLSVHCVVNNNIAQCTINYSDLFIGPEAKATTVASGTYQTDVSISVFEGKTSISLGLVQAKGTSTESLSGSSHTSEVVYTFGGWNVDAAIGTNTRNSTSGSVKHGDVIIAWSLSEKSSPCDSKANQIMSIRDGNGKMLTDEERRAIGLGGDIFMSGQTVSVPKSIPKGIDIKFFDDSRLRISSGTKYKINNCSDLDPLETSGTVKLTLLIGKIWAKIAPDPEMKWQIETERSVDGVRGTIFSTEYNPTTKTTTVIVEEGSVWLRNKFGKVETIIINEGETGTQTMDQPPVLKKN